VGRVSSSTVTLRFFGDTLEPAEVTRLIGAQPTSSELKGTVRRTRNGNESIARTGGWTLSVPNRSPADLSAQIAQLLLPLTSDLAVWDDLTKRYRADIFVGLFLRNENEGESLTPEALRLLADRHLTINFDIYGPA
jgi:hypothetical protein